MANDRGRPSFRLPVPVAGTFGPVSKRDGQA